ncbi:pyruvate kinase [Phenylobacterium montanum]|uniref:Pyruvate kinase n=1 Tax=Phenylobacterium montanum TaxID=2823693 RepID=A0A975FWH1_9CAUL|nr:pyruvate kinase [Caulobacter sp. S6]QUD86575.1 pyruvate kinase [Caulobacter sp. S6]
MIRARRARIVATLGPASRAPDKVLALAQAGADVFRLNFSHGTHEDHAATLEAIRAAEAVVERPLAALADLQGPKFRLGTFQAGRISVGPGARLRLDLDPTPGDSHRVYMPHPELFAALSPGAALLLDDGKVRLKVLDCGPDFAETEVIQGDGLSNHKGIALPGAVVALSPLTPKDREDLAFALRLGVDWVALSFVQRAADMAELRQLVQGKAAVLAKIEKPAALTDLSAILDLCDGVMVARGDLGVELDPEEVPVAQKTIVRAARRRGIPVIVATQMLESMISAPVPTRAEASDVANAVYEGADAMMLSAETAAGQFPLEAVSIMSRIIERVERDPNWPGLMDAEHAWMEEGDADALVAAARKAAESSSTACLAVYTTTGTTALRLARERPLQPVLALTASVNAARKLGLVWGLEPRVAETPKGLDDLTRVAASMAADLGLAEPHSRIWILAGTPFGSPGAANLLRLAHAPAKGR